MILMTVAPGRLSKEYRATFVAEMSSLPLAVPVVRMMTVGLLLSMSLTEIPDGISKNDDDDDDDDGSLQSCLR